MTREEEILNAAREYNNGITLSSPSNVLHFEAGAQWADEHPKNVWHDASDMPEYINRRIIYYSEYFDYYGIDYPNYLIVKYGGIEMTWEASVLRNRITKWAYISDLLPKGNAE